jgi:hypothetical protein
MPSRVSITSSATTTRTASPPEEARVELPAERADPVGYRGRRERGIPRVVAHFDGQATVGATDVYGGVARAAAGSVPHGGVNSQIGGGFDRRWVASPVGLVDVVELDGQRSISREGPQRRCEARIGEHRRVDAVGKLAQRGKRLERLVDRVAERGGEVRSPAGRGCRACKP